ncbi:MAG: nucleotide exchange factor GrpE [Candidatus Micrarchaeia archaeon]
MEKDKPAPIEQAAKAAEKNRVAAQAPAGKGVPAAKPDEEKHGFPGESAQNEIEQAFASLSDRLLRLGAEFDNYKKRTAKEKEAIALQSEARAVLRMLPIYEEIGLAGKEVARLPESEAKKGTLLVLAKLRKAFEGDGLLPMKLEGEKLDPFRHEVAFREESDAPEGTIVHVVKQGYLYKGEVLQHAIVSVSSGKKTVEEEANGGGKPAEKPEARQGGGKAGKAAESKGNAGNNEV